jgi:uncharacterized protein (DUF2147 family)
VQRTCIAVTVLVLAGSAVAAVADPLGTWLVSKGYAKIRIENCNGSLWGAVAWEQRAGGIDSSNPDPNKRGRPTLGMPVLLDMKQTETNKWSGQIYNSENGKTYDSYISLASPDVLQVRGCFILCGGEDWTRVEQPQGATTQPTTSGTMSRSPTTPSKPTGTPPTQQKPGSANTAARATVNPNDPFDYETAAADDFCSMILNGTRAPH